MLRQFEYSQVYHPTTEWEAAPDELGRPFEDVTLTAADGVRLSAWYFPAEASSPRAQLNVLVCHGNGGNVSHRLNLCRVLLRLGVGVLAFDYRGYGHSEGSLSESGTYLDAQAAYQWLVKRDCPPRGIIAFGESLGGGVAAELALRETLGGLVLQSTFTSIADVGTELFPWLPVRWLHTIRYDTLEKLPRIRIPVLVMHSRTDTVVRFHHAEKNFAAAREPKLFWETPGGHNYTLTDFDRCAEGVEKLIPIVEKNLITEVPEPKTAAG
jgi:fermentation-respiration switch protein FrsA (DUF1100 family)